MATQTLQLILSLSISAVVVAVLIVVVWVGSPWVQAIAAGTPVSVIALVRAWRRGIPVHEVTTAYLVSAKAGVPVAFERFVEVCAQGGNAVRVATMLAAMRYASFAAEPGDVFDLEVRGELAAYLRAWERAASRGEAPPELPKPS